MAVLQAEDFHLAIRAHGLGIRPDGGDLSAGDAWLSRLNASELVFEAPLVDILLLLSGLAAAEATVYTGVVAVIHAHDIHEDHVTRLNEAVGA